jgi:Zn finger protein HypA/HybF involved in hydrogenase expression
MESYLSIIIRNHEQDDITEEKIMAKCPKCGAEVSKPKKTWKMAGRPDKQGKRMQLEIGLYECPKCHATFREVLSKKKI